jgi:hypothetical protein
VKVGLISGEGRVCSWAGPVGREGVRIEEGMRGGVRVWTGREDGYRQSGRVVSQGIGGSGVVWG